MLGLRTVGATALCTLLLGAQTSEPVRFESAVIQSATVSTTVMPRGTRVDPGLFEMRGTSLWSMIFRAYRLEFYQSITGPDWIRSSYFDLFTRLPTGATKDQIPDMLRTFLDERFKLRLRREYRDQPVNVLSVAKGGPKFREVAADFVPEPPPLVQPGRQTLLRIKTSAGMIVYTSKNGVVRLDANKITIPELLGQLRRGIRVPLMDHTGLTGFYEISMFVPAGFARLSVETASEDPGMASEPEGIDIFRSIARLGLKLEKTQMPIEHLVVEHAEEKPIGPNQYAPAANALPTGWSSGWNPRAGICLPCGLPEVRTTR